MADPFIADAEIVPFMDELDRVLHMIPVDLCDIIWYYWQPDALNLFFMGPHLMIQAFWPKFWQWELPSAQQSGWRVFYEYSRQFIRDPAIHIRLYRHMHDVDWHITGPEDLWAYLRGTNDNLMLPHIRALAPTETDGQVQAINQHIRTGLCRGLVQDATRYWFIKAARERGRWGNRSISRCTHLMRCTWWRNCAGECGCPDDEITIDPHVMDHWRRRMALGGKLYQPNWMADEDDGDGNEGDGDGDEGDDDGDDGDARDNESDISDAQHLAQLTMHAPSTDGKKDN